MLLFYKLKSLLKQLSQSEMLKNNNGEIDMGNNLNDKKLMKYKNLMEAAYELFTTKGIQNTAINDIVKKAGVAKGTFYLYFKDKYDLIDKLILKKSSNILKEALAYPYTKEGSSEDFIEQVLDVVDYIINYLKNNKKLLKLIHKNLASGLYIKALKNPELYDEVDQTYNRFIINMMDRDYSRDEAEKILYIIFELVSSTLYTAIIIENPYTIEEIKPYLFNTIRRIIN